VSGKGTSTINRPSTPPRASDRGRSRLGDITRPVQIDRRIAKQRRTTFLLTIVALAIAGALAAALFLLPIQTYFNQDDRIEQRSDQLTQLESVNDDLRSEVARLGTADGVREAAREELGFVEPGERRESVLDLPPVPTDLPDGWPYSIVNDITDLRRNPPPPPTPAQP
jgi:cell division protein FtsB